MKAHIIFFLIVFLIFLLLVFLLIGCDNRTKEQLAKDAGCTGIELGIIS